MTNDRAPAAGAPKLSPRLLALKLGLVVTGLGLLVVWLLEQLPKVGADLTAVELLTSLLTALLLNQLALLAAAHRLQATLATFAIRIGFIPALRIHLQSLFYFFFVPMSVGLEMARFVEVRRLVPGVSVARLLLALLLDRLVGALAALLIAVISLPLIWPRLGLTAPASQTLLLGLIPFALSVLLALLWRPLRTRLCNARQAIASAWVQLPRLLGSGMAAHLLVVLAVYVMVTGLGMSDDPVGLGFGLSVAMLGMAVPLSLLGTTLGEPAGIGLFSVLGWVPAASLLAVSMAYCGRLLGAVQGGLLELWRDSHGISRNMADRPSPTVGALPAAADIQNCTDLAQSLIERTATDRIEIQTPPGAATQEELLMPRTEQTIVDFGAQWTRYTDNDGYYGSAELFADIVEPLLAPDSVAGMRVAEIGSGTGRIVEMLLGAGAASVTAIEPSAAFNVLRQRFAERAEQVVCMHASGEAIANCGPFDLIFSIGVLHHIPTPEPVVRAAFTALRPGGRMLIWLYGREGNGSYLAVTRPLRKLTRRLPDPLLAAFVRTLDLPLVLYAQLCRWLPLPLRSYMRNVIARMAPNKRRLIIFDQLNPSYARYYCREEAAALLSQAGFVDLRLHHRHSYSWTVIGTKPEAAELATSIRE